MIHSERTVVPVPGPSREPLAVTGTGRESRGEAGAMVLVLNSGSSSVKFALLHPGSGQRTLSGLAEQVGTARAAEDPAANAGHGRATGGRISPDGPVQALVVPTDEELMIARDAARLIAAGRTGPRR